VSRVLPSVSMGSASRNRAVLLVAAIFGILSAVLVFAFLNSQSANKTAEGGIGDALREGQGSQIVVVAVRDIAVGQTIKADMLTTKTMPPSVLLTGAITNENDIVGKVATAPIFVGEQVITAKVTTYEGQNTLAYKVPAGMRALSVMVPHEAWSNAGLAQPGDRIDVLAVTVLEQVDPLTGESRPQVLAGIIAEDVEILAVSQAVIRTIPNTDAKKSSSGGGSSGVTSGEGHSDAGVAAPASSPDDEVPTFQEAISVTLAVTPEQAAKILMIDAMGDDAAQYRLITRQKGDTAKLSGAATWTLEDVFQQVRR